MKRILIDTNVVLDVMLDRTPHAAASAALWSSIESEAVVGLLASHAVTTIHYLLRRGLGNAGALRAIEKLLDVFEIAAVDARVIEHALKMRFSDFEDAVTAACAEFSQCEWIATRDLRGFRGSNVPAANPEMIVAYLNER